MKVQRLTINSCLQSIQAKLQLLKGAAPNPLWFLLAGCALWILAHPYWGIWHDARVYTLMALHWLTPEAFARDPFFLFGSQDAYSLFSPLYAGFIRLLGVEAAARWGTLLQGMLFVACSWHLSKALPLQRANQLVFLLLVSMQWVYCVNVVDNVFPLRLSEAFVTSRNLAIPCSMLAIAELLTNRKLRGALWSLAAFVLHPLMGFWILLLWAVRQIRLPIRWIWIICTCSMYLIVGLSFVDIPPFERMDRAWIDTVQSATTIVFPNNSNNNLRAYLLGYTLLLSASRFGNKTLRRWYLQILSLVFSATLLFWVCSLYAPSALIMQVQLWRANWLALVFIIIALVDLAFQLFRRPAPHRLFFLTCALLSIASPWVTTILLALGGWRPRQCLRSSQFLLRRYHKRFWQTITVIILLLVVAVLPLFLTHSWELLGRGLEGRFDEHFQQQTHLLSPLSKSCLIGLAYTGGWGLSGVIIWGLARTRFSSTILIGLTLLALFSLPSWWQDPRLFNQNYPGFVAYTADFSPYSSFKASITPGETVYWDEHPLAIYFSLKTASYVNMISLIGIVFSQERTEEVQRRLYRVARSGADFHLNSLSPSTQKAIFGAGQKELNRRFTKTPLSSRQAAPFTREGLTYLCADPALDHVIHRAHFPELATTQEKSPNESTVWYLYTCRKVRKMAQPSIIRYQGGLH